MAIGLLREAGELTWLATGLLTRAAWIVTAPAGEAGRDLDTAARDLEEALPIVNGAGMQLALCDARLIEARRAAMTGDSAAAEGALLSARGLARKTGYRLRDADVDLVSARISAVRKEDASARAALDRARAKIEMAGYGSRRAEALEIEGMLLGAGVSTCVPSVFVLRQRAPGGPNP